MEVTHYSVTVFGVEWGSVRHWGILRHQSFKILIFSYSFEHVSLISHKGLAILSSALSRFKGFVLHYIGAPNTLSHCMDIPCTMCIVHAEVVSDKWGVG